MGIIGGELDELTTLKATFDRQSSAVQELTTTLRSQLHETYWHGPGAERFRTAWISDYEPMLRRLEQGLIEAGGEVAAARDRLIQAGS